MERKYIIYSHTTPSGKVYIGQTCQKPKQRWRNGEGYLGCILFYSSIKKYGWDNIDHKILHTGLTKEKADILEKMYIQFFKRKNISLNLADGGDGSGVHLSAETRRKLSEVNKGKHHTWTEESKQKIREANKRRVWTSESRRKISETSKGRHHTEESRLKMSEAMKGKPKKRSIWLNECNIEIEMPDGQVKRYHPNWVKVRDL